MTTINKRERPTTLTIGRFVDMHMAAAAILLGWLASAMSELRRRYGWSVPLGTTFVFIVLVLPTEAAFPGRNGLIAFTSPQEPENLDIFSMTSSGIVTRRVTEGPDLDFGPAWSPDGRKIAFVRSLPLIGSTSACQLGACLYVRSPTDIYVVNADGSGLLNITNTPLRNEFSPAWSPDGARIAFNGMPEFPSSLQQMESDLFIMDADGENVVQITHTDGPRELDPRWSPDGQSIVVNDFMRERIAVISTLGTSRRFLTTRMLRFPGHPDWSPDGTKIVFDRFPFDRGPYEIWVINADGSNARRLLDTRFAASYPRWSPDGRKIIFSYGMKPSGIYKMDADGSNLERLISITLTGRPGFDWAPR